MIGCAVSLHHMQYLQVKVLVFVFLYFWPSGFQTVITVNHRALNCHKPRVTCPCLSQSIPTCVLQVVSYLHMF